MKIIIKNWDKFNPKRDQKSYTWLRLNNDIGTQSDLFGLSAEEKFIWILILCEASKKNSGEVDVKEKYLAHISQASMKAVDNTIKYLESEGIIECDRALPRTTPNTTPTNERTNVTNETNERTNVLTPAEVSAGLDEVYKIYPRKKGKSNGMEKFKKIIKTQDNLNLLVEAVNNFAKDMAIENRPPDKIPHFSTWFRDWKDYTAAGGFVSSQPPKNGPQGYIPRGSQAAFEHNMEEMRKIEEDDSLDYVPTNFEY